MKDRDETIAWHRQYCRHYTTGRGVDVSCAAGVDMGKLTRVSPTGEGWRSAPCIHGDKCSNVLELCPKWEQQTLEYAQAKADDYEDSMRRYALVMPEVAKWRTWSKKNKVGKAEVIECPACKGKLHLSQAAYNGHVWGSCETLGCVEWME